MTTPPQDHYTRETGRPQPIRRLWPQEMLQARAHELAAQGARQEAIVAVLAQEYPDQPSENYYANPAAIAVMARIRHGQQEAQRATAHDAYLRSKGIPATYRTAAASPIPSAAPEMGRRLQSFAAVHGFTCAACGRKGGSAGDPDGRAWHEGKAQGAGQRLLCERCHMQGDADDDLI